MLADVSEHYPGKTIEYVSVYRVGATSRRPRRTATAARSTSASAASQLATIRDYVWRTYTDVGVGWYPSEQFMHIDTRPGIHDTSWTFLHGVNHYHPFWSEVARDPELAAASCSARLRLVASSRVISRFAPSTTGEAHPGHAARRRCWSGSTRARAAAARVLRLEDLDTTRVRAGVGRRSSSRRSRGSASTGTRPSSQTAARAAHEAALDRARRGRPAVSVHLQPRRSRAAAAARPTAAGPTRTRAAAAAAGRRLARGHATAARAARRRSRRARRRRRPRPVADAGARHGRSDRAPPRRRDRVPARGRRRRRRRRHHRCRARPRHRAVDRDAGPAAARCSGYPTPRYRHHFLLLEPRGEQAGQAARLDPVLAAARALHRPRAAAAARARGRAGSRTLRASTGAGAARGGARWDTGSYSASAGSTMRGTRCPVGRGSDRRVPIASWCLSRQPSPADVGSARAGTASGGRESCPAGGT